MTSSFAWGASSSGRRERSTTDVEVMRGNPPGPIGDSTVPVCGCAVRKDSSSASSVLPHSELCSRTGANDVVPSVVAPTFFLIPQFRWISLRMVDGRSVLTTLELVTFKGCESTTSLRNRIERLAETHRLEIAVRLRVVHSPHHSQENGLFGSPTILMNDVEFQRDRRGPPGFYMRLYSTTEGYRPYPTEPEILAWLKGDRVPHPRRSEGKLGGLPALVTAGWCPFSPNAVALWGDAARELDIDLRVVDAATTAGEQLIASANVAGVPCLVAAPDRLAHGLQHSPADARAFLRLE